jgi:hypothetical protein
MAGDSRGRVDGVRLHPAIDDDLPRGGAVVKERIVGRRFLLGAVYALAGLAAVVQLLGWVL